MPEQLESIEQLKYPVGRYQYRPGYTERDRRQMLDTLRQFPQKLAEALNGATESQLDTPYRPGGWTVRQVVHHVADSHINSYVRFKLAMTEERPAIKPYDQDAWAKLSDSSNTPISVSLQLLHALHTRWLVLLDSFQERDWQRMVFHPEMKREIKLEEFLVLYSWHCDHHLAHVRLVVG